MNRHLIAAILLSSCATAFAQDFKVVSRAESQTDRKGKSVLLVSLNGDRHVAVIDLITQDVLAKLPSPQGPHEITLSADATLAYVSDSGAGPNTPRGNSIVVLDLRTLSVMRTLKTCDSPHDTRVSRNGRTLWVACAPAKAVMELDAATGALRKTWDTKLDGGWFVEITPDDRKIFVPHLEGKALSMIDRRTSQVRAVVSGNTIFGLTVSPVGNEVWISDADENKLSIVNAATGNVTASISLGKVKEGESGFSRLRFTPDGERVVVVRGAEFVIVDAKRRSIVSTIQMPHPGKVVTVSGDSRYAFVSHPGADRVSVINLIDRNVERTFVVGKQPDGIAWAQIPR
jgi:YVTN family beta-propeller protein